MPLHLSSRHRARRGTAWPVAICEHDTAGHAEPVPGEYRIERRLPPGASTPHIRCSQANCSDPMAGMSGRDGTDTETACNPAHSLERASSGSGRRSSMQREDGRRFGRSSTSWQRTSPCWRTTSRWQRPGRSSPCARRRVRSSSSSRTASATPTDACPRSSNARWAIRPPQPQPQPQGYELAPFDERVPAVARERGPPFRIP